MKRSRDPCSNVRLDDVEFIDSGLNGDGLFSGMGIGGA